MSLPQLAKEGKVFTAAYTPFFLTSGETVPFLVAPPPPPLDPDGRVGAAIVAPELPPLVDAERCGVPY